MCYIPIPVLLLDKECQMANIQTGDQMMSAPAPSGDGSDYIEISVYEAKKWFRTLLSPPARTPNHRVT